MGNIGITLSLSDPAGETLLKVFRERGLKEGADPGILQNDNLHLFVINPLIVPSERYKTPEEPDPYPADYDSLAEQYDIDYIIVASRHWSRSGQPSLTVHPTGNFGKALYGGHPRELQRTVANPMRNVFLELLRDPPTGFQVTLEATHHSPTHFNTPMFFAEVGSREEQWRDEEVANYLADSIINGIKSDGEAPVAIGFGGGHYCPKFTDLEKDMAFGHIAAKYALDELNQDLIRQMVDNTEENVDFGVLDNIKGYHLKLIQGALSDFDIPIKD
jgi:D-tyrosyl-tRNA(Tyr) deacylase